METLKMLATVMEFPVVLLAAGTVVSLFTQVIKTAFPRVESRMAKQMVVLVLSFGIGLLFTFLAEAKGEEFVAWLLGSFVSVASASQLIFNYFMKHEKPE